MYENNVNAVKYESKELHKLDQLTYLKAETIGFFIGFKISIGKGADLRQSHL